MRLALIFLLEVPVPFMRTYRWLTGSSRRLVPLGDNRSTTHSPSFPLSWDRSNGQSCSRFGRNRSPNTIHSRQLSSDRSYPCLGTLHSSVRCSNRILRRILECSCNQNRSLPCAQPRKNLRGSQLHRPPLWPGRSAHPTARHTPRPRLASVLTRPHMPKDRRPP